MLANVSKMEESLRKLKKVRERGGAGAGERGTKEGDRLSDDDKIRLQVNGMLCYCKVLITLSNRQLYHMFFEILINVP